jgi:hypothetical protein
MFQLNRVRNWRYVVVWIDKKVMHLEAILGHWIELCGLKNTGFVTGS